VVEEDSKSSQQEPKQDRAPLSAEACDSAAAGSEPPAEKAPPAAGVAAIAETHVEFRAPKSLAEEKFEIVITWIKDQKTLFDAFLVALSFHVVMFPVLWFVGWALPWPKPPVVTTIVEFDLQEWMRTGKPKKIIDFRDPELNQ
jgi:hypothetical protein